MGALVNAVMKILVSQKIGKFLISRVAAFHCRLCTMELVACMIKNKLSYYKPEQALRAPGS
jgi:hypothetical protein